MMCTEMVRYSTATDALVGLVYASLVVQERTPRHPIRYYACPHCYGFHLTSKPYNPRRATRDARG